MDNDDAHAAYETTWANAGIVSNLMRHIKDHPGLKISELWNLQNEWNGAAVYKDDDTYKPTRVDFAMLDRIVWLASPARIADLDAHILGQFRLSVRRKEPFENNPALEHLPADRLDALKEISERHNTHGRRGARVAEPDQIAAVFHLSRLNASFRATQTFFTHQMESSVVNAARMLLTDIPRTGRPGWDWPS